MAKQLQADRVSHINFLKLRYGSIQPCINGSGDSGAMVHGIFSWHTLGFLVSGCLQLNNAPLVNLLYATDLHNH